MRFHSLLFIVVVLLTFAGQAVSQPCYTKGPDGQVHETDPPCSGPWNFDVTLEGGSSGPYFAVGIKDRAAVERCRKSETDVQNSDIELWGHSDIINISPVYSCGGIDAPDQARLNEVVNAGKLLFNQWFGQIADLWSSFQDASPSRTYGVPGAVIADYENALMDAREKLATLKNDLDQINGPNAAYIMQGMGELESEIKTSVANVQNEIPIYNNAVAMAAEQQKEKKQEAAQQQAELIQEQRTKDSTASANAAQVAQQRQERENELEAQREATLRQRDADEQQSAQQAGDAAKSIIGGILESQEPAQRGQQEDAEQAAEARQEQARLYAIRSAQEAAAQHYRDSIQAIQKKMLESYFGDSTITATPAVKKTTAPQGQSSQSLIDDYFNGKQNQPAKK